MIKKTLTKQQGVIKAKDSSRTQLGISTDFLLWFLVLSLIWSFLCVQGYTLAFTRRFSTKLILIFLSFLLILDMLLVMVYQELVENQFIQIRKSLSIKARERMSQLEGGFVPWLDQTAKELSSTLSSKRLQSEKIPNFLAMVEIDRDANVRNLSGKVEDLFIEVFLIGAQQVIPGIKQAQIKDIESFHQRFSRKIQSRLTLTQKVKKQFREKYKKFRNSSFHRMEFFSTSYYLYWSSSGSGSNFRMFAAIGPRQGALKEYLKWIRNQNEKMLWPGSEVALYPDGKMLVLNRLKSMDPGSIAKSSDTLPGNKDQILEILISDLPHYAIQLESLVLKGFDLLFLVPKTIAHQPIQDIKLSFLILKILSFLLFLLSAFYLARLVRNPLLKLNHGFRRIRSDTIEFELDSHGSNEIAMVEQGFNSMVLELRRRRELLPFIPHEILRLFEQKDGSFHKEISDEAAVLFSDIRSFTSISENYEAEEIVSMLNDYFSIWQRRVERYSGVIEKFIGDAVVVVFFRRNSKYFIQEAVQTSLEVMSDLKDFNSQRISQGKFTIQNGIGISCSNVSLGVIGSHKKRHFHANGPAVSRAEELEAESKNGRYTRILVDPIIYEAISHQYDLIEHVREMDSERAYEIRNL